MSNPPIDPRWLRKESQSLFGSGKNKRGRSNGAPRPERFFDPRWQRRYDQTLRGTGRIKDGLFYRHIDKDRPFDLDGAQVNMNRVGTNVKLEIIMPDGDKLNTPRYDAEKAASVESFGRALQAVANRTSTIKHAVNHNYDQDAYLSGTSTISPIIPIPEKRCNHVLHLVLSFLTMGMWVPVWIIRALIINARNQKISGINQQRKMVARKQEMIVNAPPKPEHRPGKIMKEVEVWLKTPEGYGGTVVPATIPLAAVREPDNVNDEDAVALHFKGRGRVGYLARQDASNLAPKIDSGTRYTVKLTEEHELMEGELFPAHGILEGPPF